MPSIHRCYRILGLRPGADPEEIKQAYRDLTQVWHPDRFAHSARLQEKAQGNLKRINEAYNTLMSASEEDRAARPSLLRRSVSAIVDLGDFRKTSVDLQQPHRKGPLPILSLDDSGHRSETRRARKRRRSGTLRFVWLALIVAVAVTVIFVVLILP